MLLSPVFSHVIAFSRFVHQTCMFIAEHCDDNASRRRWNSAMSVLDKGLGSGRMKLAAKEALAIATECNAMSLVAEARMNEYKEARWLQSCDGELR